MSYLNSKEFEIISGSFSKNSELEFLSGKIYLHEQERSRLISDEFKVLEIISTYPSLSDKEQISTLSKKLLLYNHRLIDLLYIRDEFALIQTVTYKIFLQNDEFFIAKSDYATFTSIQSILNLPILPPEVG